MSESIEKLAQHLLHAHASRQRFAPLRLDGAALDMVQAYRVQAHLVRALSKGADPVAGYKVGLTSRAMQQMCGISSPVYGCVLASRVHENGSAVSLANHGRLGLEFEIAVRMAADVDTVPARAEDMGAFVAAVAPAIELVDDRHADYQALDVATLVADNAWNAGIVLGAWQPAPSDLPARDGRLWHDGQAIDGGRIGDALGHPFASVHWLATALSAAGGRLRRDDIVMTGSIVRTQFPERPGAWRYEVDGLGEVGLRIADAAR